MTKMHKVFEGWRRSVENDPAVYPDDKPLLDALKKGMVPGPYMGPVLSAPVVVLTLNGKLGPEAGDDARWPKIDPEGYARHLSGLAKLPNWLDNPTGRSFIMRIPKQLGSFSFEEVRSLFAFVNAFPYKTPSSSGIDHSLRRDLPSVRDMLEWAGEELFPAARRRERVVIAARALSEWGIAGATRDGWFFPDVSFPRSGYLLRKSISDVQEAVQAAIARYGALALPKPLDIPF